jgi:hypothetical protein
MTGSNTPRRKRAQMKAWAYLALFGPGDDSTPAEESTSDPPGDDGSSDAGRPEE